MEYILSRVFQTVLVSFVLLYIWSSRAFVASLFQRSRLVLIGSVFGSKPVTKKQRKFRQRVAKEYLKWRLDIHGRFLKAVLPILSVDSILLLVMLNVFYDWQFLITRVFITGFAYCFCVLIHRGTIPMSARFFDVIFALFVLGHIGRSYAYYRGIQVASKRFRRVAPIVRSLISATYLDFPRVALGNSIISVLEMTFYSLFVGGLDVDWFFEALTQLFELAFTLVLAYVMEAGGRSYVTQRLEAKSSADGWRAVHSILSVLCDAVVHLGSDLSILDESPKLGHLLMSGFGASQKLEGGNILRHVVDEDKQRLNSFIAQQSELAKQFVDVSSDGTSAAAPMPASSPAALHISLKDAMGTTFRVEVIHAHLPNFDEDGHLLGVRDLGDHAKEECIDGFSSPVRLDETLAKQHGSCRSSSGSSDSGEGPKWEGSGKLQSLSLHVDLFDPRFPILEATLRFQNFDHEGEHIEERDVDLPHLSALLPRRASSKFLAWAEDVGNGLHHGDDVSPFGKVTLMPFGSSLKLKATSVSATMNEDAEAVCFVFDDVDVRFSDLFRKSNAPLPCIREASPVTRSSSSASRAYSAPRQVDETSPSTLGRFDSSMHLTQSL
eukprot:TRINITY_DN7713_c0_g1_i1.p1 TRINITY_DN7713_c0_g1~~TRINITY_DN7713_c0_g1_i1.p1  ORF type:complete len:627 (-),score=59.68 TRINITY_DN7713_c0_g1_i1:230-2053(-)